VFPECEGVVEVEAEVPPIQFGAQGSVSCVRSKAEVDGWVQLTPRPGKVKHLRLVMLQDEAQSCEKPVNDTISHSQLRQILHQVRGLGEDSTIVHIRQKLHLLRDQLEGE